MWLLDSPFNDYEGVNKTSNLDEADVELDEVQDQSKPYM
jgi:hypothetical protein